MKDLEQWSYWLGPKKVQITSPYFQLARNKVYSHSKGAWRNVVKLCSQESKQWVGYHFLP